MNKVTLGIINGNIISYLDSTISVTTSKYEYRSNFPLNLENRSQLVDFEYELFQRTKSIENKSMQVKIKNDTKRDKRLGWIIPISALTSVEHDFSENEHFLNYAKCAFIFLLLEIIEKKSPENLDIDINQYFSDKVHIFCYYKPNFNDLSINEITFSLFAHGYYKYNEQESKLLIDYAEADELFVTKISNNISNIEYIHSLVTNFIPKNDIALFDFYYMYQIIEVLINQILIVGKNDAISELLDCDSASQIRESIYAINELLSEKNRIKKLFNEYAKVSSVAFKHDLIQNINDFLQNNEISKQSITLEDAIYKLRNLLIHNHFKVKNFNGLDQINNYFRELLSNIVTNIEIAS